MPDCYLLHRPVGGEWGEARPVYGDEAEPAGARAKARALVKMGLDGLEVGKLYEWRLVRFGVVRECWDEDGREP